MITKEQIVNLLKTNDKAVARALVVLTERQTADEQASENTKYHNGKGFRPCHARMGTSMAKFFLARGYLTPKQVGYFRQTDKSGKMRIEIYAGQLLEVAEAKANLQTPKMVPVTANDATSQAGCKGAETPTAAEVEAQERVMQEMETQADREQTAREEAAKFAARQVMERAPVSSWDAIFAGVK